MAKIKPSEKHVEKILKIGPQTAKKGVTALLGMINYHHDMIPGLATITYCLTELLKRDQPEKNIRWQQKHSDALEKKKEILTSKPILVAPKFDRAFIIMCDATNCSVASLLAQKDDQGIERNVAYYSRKLLPREQNYSVIEKECLAILASCLHWHNWIYGYKILVRTDHSSLRYLNTAAQHNARLARWYIILSNYDLTTEYRKGALHSNCDGLSRVEIND
jgi:hypothetical protein